MDTLLSEKPDEEAANHTQEPTSEVGFARAQPQAPTAVCDPEPWKVLLELQSRSMLQLIEAMKQPPSTSITLPEFNPEVTDADPRAWCSTVDICLAERPLEGGALIIALSKSLKGSASSWLSQVSHAGMKWSHFKDLFLARYECAETVAAALININNGRPMEGECLAAYAARLLTKVNAKWKDLTTEQIAISYVLAHTSQFDSRLQRLAFTTTVTNRTTLLQEMNSFSYLKRKASDDGNDASTAKRTRFPTLPSQFKCHHCGKPGHKAIDCRLRKFKGTLTTPSSTFKSPPTTTASNNKTVVCYNCNQRGHYSRQCTAPGASASQRPQHSAASPAGNSGAPGATPQQRRVDACEIRGVCGNLTQSDALILGVTQNEGESRSNLNISDVLDAISLADPTFGVEPEMYRPAAAPATGAVDRPYVRIVEQPAAKSLRFRYQCEGRSAGSIPGANSTPERKTYPTIEVCGYKGRFVVLVSCVTKDKPYRPHPHNLVGREPMCNRGVCTVEMNGDSSIVQFSNLGIQCVKRKDIAEALKERENMKVDPFKTGFTHKNQPQTIDLNAVRLCFQVYIPGGNTTKIKQALYPCVSDVIYDKKAMCELQINRLSSCAASVRGGQEIILLCEKITREDIEVVFSQKKEDGSHWESTANIVLVHRQVAIAFHVPPYRDPAYTEHAKVNIFLRRTSDKACSAPVDFEYTPDFADSDYLIKKKRKTAHIESFLQTAYKQDRGFVHDSVIKTEPKEQIASPPIAMGALSPHYAQALFADHGDPRHQQWIPEQSNLNMPGQTQFLTEARGYWGPHNYGQAPSPNTQAMSPNMQGMSPGHRLSPMPPMMGQGLMSPMQGGVSPAHPSSIHPSPTPQMMHQASPTPQMMHQASPSPQMMHQASPTPQMMHQASPTPQMMHQASPTPQMMHQVSSPPQMMPQSMQIQQPPMEAADVVLNSADLSGIIAMLGTGPELTDSMSDLNL